LLTVKSCLVVQPSKQHEALIFVPRKVGDTLRALLEPFVIPGSSPRHDSLALLREKKKGEDTPLSDDDAALPSLHATPHPATLFEVLRSRVDRVQGWRFGLAPVGNETPFHRVHHEGGLFRLCAANDRCVGPRGNIVAGYIAISVYPLFDAKCGVVIELLDVVGLVRGFTRFEKMI
jgi:hypothetical protein